jgi:tetratricopeptide (TPR) repeat protein
MNGTVEVINALGNNWPIVGVLCLTFLIFILRKSIAKFIEKASELQYKQKKKDTETEFSIRGEGKPKEVEKPELVEQKTIIETTETIVETIKDEATSEEEKDEFSQVYLAIKSQDFEQAEALFKKIQEEEKDDDRRFRFETYYLYLRYQFGDTSALEKLKVLSERPEASVYAYHWIGQSYEVAGNFKQAAEAYKVWAERTITEGGLATAIVKVADSLYAAGQKEEAYEILISHINKVKSSDALSELYMGLVSLYKSDKNMEFRVLALEKAVENSPNNIELRYSL